MKNTRLPNRQQPPWLIVPMYFVQVLVLAGILLASTTISALAACSTVPQGLVSWWQAEGDTLDNASTNNGVVVGNVTYGPGEVSQGFILDGSADGIMLGNPASLQLQNLTIEAWIKRASSNEASHGTGGAGTIFSAGSDGYFFWMQASGNLCFNRWGDVSPIVGPVITDTAFHHVAVTKSGTTVTFYLDGQASPAVSYSGTFTFPTSIAIGFHPDTRDFSFWGTIDEVSVYNRGLDSNEIQAIYAAGNYGKCTTPVAPVIYTQPSDRTAYVGAPFSFNVIAGGTPPLRYQWRLDGTNLAGATSDVLKLGAAQLTDAGPYSVVVSNDIGSVVSSNALLTVLPAPPCSAAPEGLVAWWRAEGDAGDQVGGVVSTSIGNLTYGAGKVGQGFVLDGIGDGVALGNPAALQLQNLTIELWIKRASASLVTASGSGYAIMLAYGSGGYFFWMETSGILHFNRYGDVSPLNGPAITDTAWHHVAVAKAGTNVTFFLDGQAYSSATYTGTFTFTTSVGIGFSADSSGSSFLGSIDEVSVYNRGLTTNEIQAIYAAGAGGKCVTPFPAFVVSSPANQTAMVGSTAVFTVVAGGTPPFTYQWTRSGTNLPGARASSLSITNVQFSDAGSYAATVSNVLNSATSASGVLSVVFPPASVRAVTTSGMGGGSVTVPVEIAANGNENALQFSLSYNPSLLTYASTSLGTNVADATLFVNTNQIASGRLGVVLALPTDTAMLAGTQQVVSITFGTAVRSSVVTTPVSFGDNPTVRQLVDKQAATLNANYTSGNVTLTASVLEGDISPRPNGDRAVTVSDWVLLGRYAARLDYPTNASEFQRADCAPRSTLGDGAIKVTDWVQVGRYAAAADPLTVVGGPTTENPGAGGGGGGSIPKDGSDRTLLIGNSTWFVGQTGTVSVVLKGTGNESALGFSLAFDPARFGFVRATKGAGAGNATLNVNTTAAGNGKLGVAIGLSSGTLPSGSNEIVRVTLRALPGAATGTTAVGFADQPVPREISDGAATPLAVVYENGAITVYPSPLLNIGAEGGGVVLTWPGWATNFVLQSSGTLAPAGWTNAEATPVLVNGECKVGLPANSPTLFYRLTQP